MEYYITPIAKKTDQEKDWKNILSSECSILKKSIYENPTDVLNELKLNKDSFYENNVFKYLKVNTGSWEFYLLSLFMDRFDDGKSNERRYTGIRDKINEVRETTRGRDAGPETFRAFQENYGSLWDESDEIKSLRDKVKPYIDQLFKYGNNKTIRETVFFENRRDAAKFFYKFIRQNTAVKITNDLCKKSFDKFLIPFIEEEIKSDNPNYHFLASGVLVCLFGHTNPHKNDDLISMELKEKVVEGLKKLQTGDKIIDYLENIDDDFEPIQKSKFTENDRNGVKLRIGTWKSLLANTLKAQEN